MTTLAPGTPIAGAAALVTGGHRGFGLALVNELLDRGAVRVHAKLTHAAFLLGPSRHLSGPRRHR